MDTQLLYHVDDPDVSRDAIEAFPKLISHRIMQVIVDLIGERGPLTPKELEHIYQHGMFTEPTWPETKPFNVAKRASEMKNLVLVVDHPNPLGVLAGTKVRREGAEALILTVDPTTALAKIRDYWAKS
jgi:hypothetical protein